MKAIIGGTGIDTDPRFQNNVQRVVNRYGESYYAIDGDIVFLARHRPRHTVAPHLINYRANIETLKDLGVDGVISIYSVGSITRRIAPSRMGLVKDFIDFTYGRQNSFFDGEGGVVRHTPMFSPFDRELGAAFVRNAFEAGTAVSLDAVYVTTNGPRFETAAEIEAYRRMGADIVGMTLATEAELMRELGIRNAAVAFSINWAAGLDAEGISFLEDESIERIASQIISIAVRTLSS